MASTNFTPNLDLSQFVDADKPTWRGDYNNDMLKIDEGLKKTADDLNKKITDETTARAQADDSLDKKITDEASERTKADNQTQANLTATQKILTDQITAEASARTKADSDNYASLDGKIAALDKLPDTLHAVALDNKNTARVKFISHRGGEGWPEQSIEGCMESIQKGFIPEVDVRLLKDGTPVLCHDDTVIRTMYSTAGYSDTLVSQIADLRSWKQGFKLKPTANGGRTCIPPSLEDLLANCANRGILNIEVKQLDDATLNATIDAINKYHAKNSVILASFSVDLMQKAKAQGFTTMCFAGNENELQNVLNINTNKPDYIGVHYGICTTTIRDKIQNFGAKMTAWTPDQSAQITSCIDAGAYMVTTNRPSIADNYNQKFENLGYKDGKILQRGLLDCYRPYNSVNINHGYDFQGKTGLFLQGDRFGQNVGTDEIQYMVIEPYQCRGYCLDNDEDSINVHLDGYEGPIDHGSHHTTRDTFAKLVIFNGGADDHWLDDASTKFAMFLARRYGEVAAFARDHKDGAQQSAENHIRMTADDGSEMTETNKPAFLTKSRLHYTLDVHFHKSNFSFDLTVKDKNLYGTINYPNNVIMSGRNIKLVILLNAGATVSSCKAEVANITSVSYGTGRPN